MTAPIPLPASSWRSPLATRQALDRATRPDFPAWLAHVRQAADCAAPIRLAGAIDTVEPGTGRLLSTMDTTTLPDGVIYKRCGNRRATACPACSRLYQRDAYQVVHAGLAGGKGVPEKVAAHPAVFVTLTAPSFGPVHTRYVKRHTCASRRRCDCRPEPCHPRRDHPVCPHSRPLSCYARHDPADPRLGGPLCPDCYDYPTHIVWNHCAGELWRRTKQAIDRRLARVCRQRGIKFHEVPVKDGKVRRVPPIRVAHGKAAEMQRRAAVHFHAILRLDGADPTRPGEVLPPPDGLSIGDLVDAVGYAVRATVFATGPHPVLPAGWPIGWGEQLKIRVITVAGDGDITDAVVAGYLAKYATKSTEVTGHVSRRLDGDTIDLYADPAGTHPQRLLATCWDLGKPPAWRGLRLWAHMLGFGGHFLTKSRTYSVTFRLLRDHRIVFRRTVPTGPSTDEQTTEPETTLVVNFLQFVGAGWHTTGDALLANTSAALAREHAGIAQQNLVALTARLATLDRPHGETT